MRVFRMTYRAQTGESRQSKKWAIEFRDHRDIVRRIAGFTDEGQTRELGRKVERLVAVRANNEQPDPSLQAWIESMPPRIRKKLVRADLLDLRRVAASQPLTEHLEDYRQALEAKGNSPKHVQVVTSRVRNVIEGCRISFWSDISASQVQAYLHARRSEEEKFGAQTFNFYLQAMKQFCRWMVRERRALESPLDHLTGLNVKTDRRHDRRALSIDEMRYLLDAALTGEVYQGRKRRGQRTWLLTGPRRALLYRLTMETGLRASEIRSLTRSSFDLEAAPPKVTVKAAYSKRRRDDELPLRDDMAETLRPWLDDLVPGEPLFPMPRPEKLAEYIVRPDLEVGRNRWLSEAESSEERERRENADFLRYVDGDGLYADFHALRHSFITNVNKTGVHFKTTQELARHSTPALTARYTHSFRPEEIAAVNALPDLGTVVRTVGESAPNSASNSAFLDAESRNSVQVDADLRAVSAARARSRNPNSRTVLDNANTGCDDPSRPRRDAGVAERGGLENH